MSMPPGAPDPYAQPPGAPLPPGPPPPPPGGYAVPSPQYSGGFDPLVPAGADFGSWFAKVQEVAKRSWRSALIIVGLGIAAPYAVLSLIQSLADVSRWVTPTAIRELSDLSDVLGSLALGLFVTLIGLVIVSYVASAGWLAGSWALTQEAATGQPANVQAAFRYGFKRAMALWPWTILVAIMVFLGICACFLPSIYLAFATCVFGFVAAFERGQNPIGRSFKLTHSDFGPALGKYLILFVVYFVYSFIIGLIFGAIQVAVAVGTVGTFGYNFMFGIIAAIETLLTTPGYALLLLGLLPLYTQLRAREGAISTPQLQHELEQ